MRVGALTQQGEPRLTLAGFMVKDDSGGAAAGKPSKRNVPEM
jgi:hypothetical protein